MLTPTNFSTLSSVSLVVTLFKAQVPGLGVNYTLTRALPLPPLLLPDPGKTELLYPFLLMKATRSQCSAQWPAQGSQEQEQG